MTDAGQRTRMAIPLVWAAAMLAARTFDPWIPIAIVALGMSATVLASDRELMRDLLRPAFRPILIGLLASAVMIAATYLLFPLVTQAIPTIGIRTGNLYAMFLVGRPRPSVLLFVIPIILAEEILWRGAFQEWVAMRFPSRPVLIVALSAAVYAIAHAPFGSALLVVIAFACGLFWSALRGFSRSLLPSLIAHLAWDLALILIPLHKG